MRKMFYLKSCPRCHGDLYEGADMHGGYTACIQCSHYLTDAEESQLKILGIRPPLKTVTLAQEQKAAA